MTGPDDRERLFQQLQQLQGVMRGEDLATALGISPATLRHLGIPHVRLARASRIYFPDEVIAWLRSQERQS